jgi:tetratricopeptide (TPR) repeat protein
MKSTVRLVSFAAAFIVVAAVSAHAQSAQVRGELRGEGGSAVSGVVINFDRIDQGFDNHYELATDDRGDFVHLSIAPGDYEITFLHDENTHFVVSRISAGDVEINLNLESLEYDSYEFSRQTGTVEHVIRDIRQISARAVIQRSSEALSDEEVEERAEAERSDSAMREAFQAGRDALDAGDYETAVRQFQLATEGPGSQQHIVHANLGVALERLQRFDEAAAAFERAQLQLELDAIPPEETNYFQNLVVNYANAGEGELALEYAERGAEVDPDGAGTSFTAIGIQLVNSGDPESALGAFQRAIELDPNSAEAYYQSGIIHLSSEASIPMSIPMFERYLELAPDGPNAGPAAELLKFAQDQQ